MKKNVKNLPDTNILIRYLTRDNEPLYEKAKAFFDQVKEGSAKAVLLESVIAESIYVLTKIYRVPKSKAAQSLIDILRYKGIANEDQKELIRALSLFSERNIDIVDCILCVKAADPETSLFSFDNALNKMSASLKPLAHGPD
ncbi:MAG: PIN domain-containing protein [Desulfatitalea sp.]|nr:PIN domain-containing protein [Desulfatitalea sp.]MBI5895316.1 PIN domain-containing protein [Desulfobacterales bacterium]